MTGLRQPPKHVKRYDRFFSLNAALNCLQHIERFPVATLLRGSEQHPVEQIVGSKERRRSRGRTVLVGKEAHWTLWGP